MLRSSAWLDSPKSILAGMPGHPRLTLLLQQTFCLPLHLGALLRSVLTPGQANAVQRQKPVNEPFPQTGTDQRPGVSSSPASETLIASI